MTRTATRISLCAVSCLMAVAAVGPSSVAEPAIRDFKINTIDIVVVLGALTGAKCPLTPSTSTPCP